MIIKKADDRAQDIATLERIKSLSYINDFQAKRAEKELIALRSGLKGEREASYHINFHSGDGEKYAIIHDLRLEHEGRVAQIDHLVIGRLLQVFLCETKYWSDSITINDQGEFSAHYGQKTIGIPSPIMQNARQMKVLSSVLESGRIERPKRLGVTLPVKLNPITLVSTGANIHRAEGLDKKKYAEVIKADQYYDYTQAHMNTNMSTLSLGRLVSASTLRNFAESIAVLHTPIQIDYWAKFGVRPPASAAVKSSRAPEPKAAKTPKQYFCAVCKEEVELKVARFCWFNKERFNSEIRCRTHQ